MSVTAKKKKASSKPTYPKMKFCPSCGYVIRSNYQETWINPATYSKWTWCNTCGTHFAVSPRY